MVYCLFIILQFRNHLLYQFTLDFSGNIISNVSIFINLKHPAFDKVKTSFDDNSIAKPPNYFKLGTWQEIDEQFKAIKIMVYKNIPISNCKDGVSVKKNALQVLNDLYGMSYPSMTIRFQIWSQVTNCISEAIVDLIC